MGEPRTEQQIVDDANELAREFYRIRGYEVPVGYRFDQATHPHEVAAWQQAVYAYDFIQGTDVEDALAQVEDENS